MLRPLKRKLAIESLEDRRCMAASVGWDGPGLGSADLTYHIDSRGSGLSDAAVEQAIESALEAWSSVVDVNFTKTDRASQRDSLDFRFRNLDSGGNILAQAYLPDDVNPVRIAGDIEFDSSETWEIGNGRGNSAFDLTLVAAHEIGHALGLDHLNILGSVMYPSVGASQSFSGLKAPDIDEALRIYAAETPAVPDPVDTTISEESDASDDSTVPDPPTTPTFSGNWFWGWRGFWWRQRWNGISNGESGQSQGPSGDDTVDDTSQHRSSDIEFFRIRRIIWRLAR